MPRDRSTIFRLPEPVDKLLSFCRCCASVRQPRKSAAPSGCRSWSRTDGTNNQAPRRRPYQRQILVFSADYLRLSRHGVPSENATAIAIRRFPVAHIPCNSVSRNLVFQNLVDFVTTRRSGKFVKSVVRTIEARIAIFLSRSVQSEMKTMEGIASRCTNE